MSPKKIQFSSRLKDIKIEEKNFAQAEDFFGGYGQAEPDNHVLQDLAEQAVSAPAGTAVPSEDWFAQTYEGQLSVDVFQTDKEIIIQAAVAGVHGEDIDLELANDMITIKGVRRTKRVVQDDDYLIKECYFGGFSRSIILPVDIQHDKVRATLEQGVLTIVLPKSTTSRHSKISVQEIN